MSVYKYSSFFKFCIQFLTHRTYLHISFDRLPSGCLPYFLLVLTFGLISQSMTHIFPVWIPSKKVKISRQLFWVLQIVFFLKSLCNVPHIVSVGNPAPNSISVGFSSRAGFRADQKVSIFQTWSFLFSFKFAKCCEIKKRWATLFNDRT